MMQGQVLLHYMQHKQAIKKNLSTTEARHDIHWWVLEVPLRQCILPAKCSLGSLGVWFPGHGIFCGGQMIRRHSAGRVGELHTWEYTTRKVGDTSVINLVYHLSSYIMPPWSNGLSPHHAISLIKTGAKRLERSRLCTHRKLISAIWMDFSKTCRGQAKIHVPSVCLIKKPLYVWCL